MNALQEALAGRPRVGLVLGAGGVPGHAFHAGALAAIEQETGWDPRTAEVIVGTSAGSQVGALLRAGFSAQDLAAHVEQRDPSPEGAALLERAGLPPELPQITLGAAIGLPRLPSPRLVARALLRPSVASAMTVAAAAAPAGRMSMDEHIAWLRRVTGRRWPQDRLWICAVRLADGRRVVLGRHGARSADVPTAVAASCAIPGWFTPVTIGGREHVDGGVRSPTNADVLRDQELDVVLVSSPMSAGEPCAEASALDRLPRALSTRLLHQETAVLREHGMQVFTVEPGREARAKMGTSVLDDRHVGAILADTRRAVTRQIREQAAATDTPVAA